MTGIEKEINENKKISHFNGINKSQEWLELAIKSAKMCAYQWDLKTGIILRSHDSALESRTDPNSESWNYTQALQLIHPEDRQFVHEKVIWAIENHCDFDVEYRINSGHKETRWLQTKGHAVYDNNGVAVQVFSVAKKQQKEKKTR